MTRPFEPRSAAARVARATAGAAPAIAALLIVAVVVEEAGSASSRQLVVNALVALIAVVGIQMYVGNTGVLSFGHLAFMAVGAYTAALVTIPLATRRTQIAELPLFGSLELGFPASIAVAALAAGVVAAVLGVVFARFNGTAAVIATFGLLQICNVTLYGLKDVTAGAQGLYGVPRTATVVWAAAIAGLVVLAARVLRESRLGMRLQAGRGDELAAAAAGVNVRSTRWVAWTLSGAVVGVAGGLQAHSLAIVSPGSFFLVPTFTFLAMLIVGGAGTVSGAIAGVVIVTAASQVLRGLEDGFAIGSLHVGEVFGATQIVVGLLTLVMLVLRPGGLLPRRELDERARR